MEITCDSEHIYRVDGKIVPGYSEIATATGLVKPYNGDPWYGERGTAVHTVCDLIDADELDESSIDGSDGTTDLTGYADAYRKYLHDHQHPIWDLSEAMLYHPVYNYCGTIDRVMLGMADTPCYDLLDIKTSKTANPLQLMAYAELLTINGHEVDKMYFLFLKEDGTYKPKEIKHNAELADIWLSAVKVYNYINRNK